MKEQDIVMLYDEINKILLMGFEDLIRNGFGIELPIRLGLRESVSGAKLERGLVDLASNGTKVGQNNAVIMVFEDAFDVIPFVGNKC